MSLQEATRSSTAAWQRDLAALFTHAKDRFPDVVWELTTDDRAVPEEVWGHKAIVYARAPPSFQSRYFSFRPQTRGSSPLATSALSLDIPRNSPSPSPSPFRTASPAPSTTVDGITRLTTSINPALFSNELEYLYTGQGFGEAFEFLFDEQQGDADVAAGDDAEELRIDKLRKDLVFMWRSRLYSDIRIALTSNGPPAPGDDDDAHDRQMPVFSSHRFILASRCSYFHTALVSWPSPSKSLSSSLGDPLTLSLPSPPFTPASLHFTLGFLYTGTLVFSHRTYDLSTALALLLSANYLSLPTLHAEVQARVVTEMAHGLFHALLPFTAYEELTHGAWRAGGCTCRKCAARIPRILEFALRPDVSDAVLERGARRALVGLFGVGWCTPEFAALPPKLHAVAIKGLAKRTTPANALAILWAAEAARARLAPLVDAWADVVRLLVDSGRAGVDAVLAGQTAACLAEADWVAIMRADGVRFEDGERVEWVMRSVVRGVNEGNAGRVYQALVNVLLLPHPDPVEEGTFPAQPLLSQTSHVRVQVEQARMDVLTWLKRGGRGRADRVAREGGLDDVEGWAIREIGDFLEISVEDLLGAMQPAPAGTHTRTSTTASAGAKRGASTHLKPDSESTHSLSIHTQQSSMRVSVLSRGIPTPRGARSVRSHAPPVPDEADEEQEQEQELGGDRPDSKLTPEPGTHGALFAADKPPVPTRALPVPAPVPAPPSPSSPSPKSRPTRSNVSVVSVSVSPAPRPRSSASPRPGSAASTSTVRTTRGLRPPPGGQGAARRASGASTSTAASVSDFRTAQSASRASTSTAQSASRASTSTAPRSRQSSVSSVVSRTRKTSGASDVSVRTTGGSGGGAHPPMPALDPAVRKRPTPSVRSGASTSTMDTAASAARRAVVAVRREREKRPEVKVITLKQRGRVTPGSGAAAKEKEKEREREKEKEKAKVVKVKAVTDENDALDVKAEEKEHRKTDSTASTASQSTLKVKRKGSGDTVSTVVTTKAAATALSTKTAKPVPTPKSTLKDLPLSPRGAMLEIGIPCIISSKRKRFKAFARYIGEVEGEAGPWVGVEVPAGSTDNMQATGRQWHDGSWGGIRYFEIGSTGSEWEYGDESRDRAARRRRVEGSAGSAYGTQKGIKRVGESLGGARGAKRIRSASPAVSEDGGGGESRGLFVRPSAVLYVVDAVGADL
ncbi:hypothetical protein B0H10DRAFT_2192593 [Mycena sp. CBHHK59/15]|nr:hypothetical protein B0H10DRAFT_2192593 [Mycena sp. CBHHK59/15]